MKLLRYRLRPTSAWNTPWQADTLTGILCCAYARSEGRERMYDEIQTPALRGRPPFVLSDAYPGDMLPLPLQVRAQTWRADERKLVKRSRFVTSEHFRKARSGQRLTVSELGDDASYLVRDRWRNAIDRSAGGTGAEGELFASVETCLASAGGADSYLSVYAAVEEGWEERLAGLFRQLSDTGFGADASIGRGQFDFIDNVDDATWLQAGMERANGCVSLSTFQPGANDPTDGYWETFVKYGRLAPDFGIADVFKRPLLMFRPGASFRCAPAPVVLGRAVAMGELLSEESASALEANGYQIAHFAFGLAVPFTF